MRLIDSGVVEWPPRNITCRCGAIWEIHKEDLQLYTERRGGNIHDEYDVTVVGFTCGICGEKVKIESSPSLITDLVLVQKGRRYSNIDAEKRANRIP